MNLTLSPRVSEKAMALAERGQYVFDVPMVAVKAEIAKAVEGQFKVKVQSVNILVHKGKAKTFRRLSGQQSDTKKAVVKLQKGQSITLFEGAK